MTNCSLIVNDFRIAEQAKRDNIDHSQQKLRACLQEVSRVHDLVQPDDPALVPLAKAYELGVESDLFVQEFQQWDDLTTQYANPPKPGSEVTIVADPRAGHHVQEQARRKFSTVVTIVNTIDSLVKKPKGGGGFGLPVATGGGLGFLSLATGIFSMFQRKKRKAAEQEREGERRKKVAVVRAIGRLKPKFKGKNGEPNKVFIEATEDPDVRLAYEESKQEG